MENKYWLHFKTIAKHKWYVFNACKDLGIPWRGIKHDLSKLGPTEFIASARHFQGDRSPIDAEKEAQGYSLAWQHHKGHNSHHWQYWLDNKGKMIYALRMPRKDVLELIADWIGAGKAYKQGTWTQWEPWRYWESNKEKMILHDDTYNFIQISVGYIRDYGWERYTKVVKYWEY